MLSASSSAWAALVTSADGADLRIVARFSEFGGICILTEFYWSVRMTSFCASYSAEGFS